MTPGSSRWCAESDCLCETCLADGRRAEPDGWTRPGYTLFLDWGLSLRPGRVELTLTPPIRLRQNFPQSIIDPKKNFPGGGDLADYVIYAGFTQRL